MTRRSDREAPPASGFWNLARALRQKEAMTESRMGLIERLQLEAQTWEGTGPNGLDYLGELLHEAAAALTACRAACARLQEEGSNDERRNSAT